MVEFHDLGGYAGLQCLYGINLLGEFGILRGARRTYIVGIGELGEAVDSCGHGDVGGVLSYGVARWQMSK